MKKYLFLHFGPGGNAALERHWLADESSVIDFWDQPILENTECTYEKLFQKVEQKFLSQKYDGIIAHSFSCEMALQIQKKNPSLKKIILLSPMRNIPYGFTCFARKLHKKSEIQFSETESCLLSPARIQDFFSLVQMVVADPLYYRAYWGNKIRLQEFEKIATTLPPLQMLMWQNILVDFLTHDYADQAFSARGEVYLGLEDPYYCDLEKEKKYWEGVGMTCHLISEAGHYPHLEQNILADKSRI